MINYKYIFVFLFILFCSINVSAQSAFKIFHTQQTPQSLMASLKPLYGTQASFAARNNTLIVKAAPEILNEIEDLLKQLDKPIRNLLIEVKSTQDNDEFLSHNDIGGRIKLGKDAEITSKTSRPYDRASSGNGTTVRYKHDGTVINTTHKRRHSSSTQPETFQVRATEGHWALIQTGQRVPYYSATGYKRYRHYYGPDTVNLHMENVTSGFEVFPLINEERVTLKIRPYNASLSKENPERINKRSVNTMVTGQLGEWIYLGGASTQHNDKERGFSYSTKRRSQFDTQYKMRVTILD
jgi:type II secretory pathway component HofQ